MNQSGTPIPDGKMNSSFGFFVSRELRAFICMGICDGESQGEDDVVDACEEGIICKGIMGSFNAVMYTVNCPTGTGA
jgi:hypothetical protein